MRTKTTTILTYDEWEETYKPIKNYTEDCFSGQMFETFGDDLAFVESCSKSHVWTLVSNGDRGAIVEGMRFVDRLGYFVTLRPRQWDELFEVEL